jgi:pyruvate dehydrogenase E2 component (dihydrolipoamide acetyltransferase)
MAKEVRLPQLGQTMEEGTVVNCLVKVGDEVKRGKCIFEIETDKATLEMESPADGFVKALLVETGKTLKVGEPMLVLGAKDESVSQGFIDSLKGVPAGAAVSTVAPAAAESFAPAEESAEGRIIASPRAKSLAKEMGIDLSSVKGTGPGGKITEQDVKDAAQSTIAAAPATGGEIKLGAVIRLNKVQKLTAERMLKSKQEIPCFYLNIRADVTEMVALRAKHNQGGGVKIAYNDIILKTVANGLEKFPLMTGQLVGDAIELARAINVGLAVALPDGLIVPVVKDANKKTLMQIAAETAILIENARDNKLLLTDLEGACITVSNLGALGIDSFIPVVIPGQCSIMGIGAITDNCVPSNGGFALRKMMNISLSVDHKIANGAYAAGFLDFVKQTLEDPSRIL